MARPIRLIASGADLPVFLITGRHKIGDQQRAGAKDISGFFRKPFDGPALLTAVGNALRV
jgi:CheY-like chemotaxis protein